jgi:hypothetical protein
MWNFEWVPPTRYFLLFLIAWNLFLFSLLVWGLESRVLIDGAVLELWHGIFR